MSAIRSGTIQLGLFFATAFALLMQPTTSQAYRQDEEAACSGDAFRLCSSEIPDVDRVTACMERKKSQLSPECRVFFRPGYGEAVSARAGRPMSIRPAALRKPASAKTRKKPKKPDAT
jgi:hypothetical protein